MPRRCASPAIALASFQERPAIPPTSPEHPRQPGPRNAPPPGSAPSRPRIPAIAVSRNAQVWFAHQGSRVAIRPAPYRSAAIRPDRYVVPSRLQNAGHGSPDQPPLQWQNWPGFPAASSTQRPASAGPRQTRRSIHRTGPIRPVRPPVGRPRSSPPSGRSPACPASCRLPANGCTFTARSGEAATILAASIAST